MTVLGVDITHYLRELRRARAGCVYSAADFEALSQFAQKSLDYPEYSAPVLVGFSSGATLAYVALAQSPPGTFRGAISLGFCPYLDVSLKFCRGTGLESGSLPEGKGTGFGPAQSLPAPWVLLHGGMDEDCLPKPTEEFARKVPRSEFIFLPKVGHGFGVARNWVPQFKPALMKLLGDVNEPAVRRVAAGLEDLPLVEVAGGRGKSGKEFAILLSGDGGWASIDREVSGVLAEGGLPVVGLDSLRYFWKSRTPDGAARDLERVARAYFVKWGKERVILAGYSWGANVLPFLATRLPAALKERVSLVVLIAPTREAAFEFHIADWLGGNPANAYPVLPEIRRMGGTPILCFSGADEKDSPCRELGPPLAECLSAEAIISRLRRPGG
jgi:type IV secretory pathway VirJ component